MESWREGVRLFNEGRFWEAHEAWERGWTKLEDGPRRHIQAMIQAAAVFHLLGLGREDAACRLAGSALGKLSSETPYPRIEVPGLESFLRELSVTGRPRAGEAVRIRLQARLLLSPDDEELR